MGTKERLAEGLERLARLVPGLGSYQDKEGLRERDKRLRDSLADRLDGARKAVEKAIDGLQRQGHLANLDRLGHLDRRLHHAADTIRFASRGYAGVFDDVKIDEEKLERLCAWDISLAESVSAIEEAAKGLKGISAEGLAGDALRPLEDQLVFFDDKVRERQTFFLEP
jgi:hypothetical protein